MYVAVDGPGMAMSRATVERRVEEYWDWLAAALFLLVAVDLLTTLAAAATVGVAAEANPVVAWALHRGVLALVAVNLLAVVAACLLFAGVTDLLRRTPPRHREQFALAVEVWLGGLVAAGLLVFANNLATIVYQESLL